MASIHQKNQARQRRAEARRELIANSLRLGRLTEPMQRAAGDDEGFFWSERRFIEERNAELRQVIDEARQVEQEPYTP